MTAPPRPTEVAHLISRTGAGVMFLVAVVVNKWTLEILVTADGRIESSAILAMVGAFQIIAATMGAVIWRSNAPWASSASLLILTVAISGTATELFFRTAVPPARYPAPRVDSLLALPIPGQPGDSVQVKRSVYSSNPSGYFGQGNSIDHYLNRGGWHDVDHEVNKPGGTFRIVGLGDSYLFGQGVRFEDNVLTRVGDLMRDSVSLGVEAINFGRSGSNTQDQLSVLDTLALQYGPDLVVVFFVLNDVETDLFGAGPRMEFFYNFTNIYQRPDQLSRVSRAWSWARHRFLSSYAARRYVQMSVDAFVQDQVGWELSKKSLLAIQERTEAAGAGLLLVVFPFFYALESGYPFQVVHDLVSTFAREHAIEVVDLRDAFPGFDGPELWVHETDQHPNAEAHALAASAVFRYLQDHPYLIQAQDATTGNPMSAQPR